VFLQQRQHSHVTADSETQERRRRREDAAQLEASEEEAEETSAGSDQQKKSRRERRKSEPKSEPKRDVQEREQRPGPSSYIMQAKTGGSVLSALGSRDKRRGEVCAIDDEKGGAER